jgi:DNA-binding NarL/FixJ family response regulator
MSKINAIAADNASVSKSHQLDFDTIFSITTQQLSGLLTKRTYAIPLNLRLVSIAKMEICVLVELLKGSHAGQIAEELGIKQTTVESYLVNIKNKLAVDSKSELIRLITSKKILQRVKL